MRLSKNLQKYLKVILIIFFSTSFLYQNVFSAEKQELLKIDWSFKGYFGKFDRASLQRGYQVYTEVCAACHGIRHVSYRDLKDIGFSSDEIKSIAGEYEITDGPNDEGEMFEREARPSDKFVEEGKQRDFFTNFVAFSIL